MNSSRKDTEENAYKINIMQCQKKSRTHVGKDGGNMKLFQNSYDCPFSTLELLYLITPVDFTVHCILWSGNYFLIPDWLLTPSARPLVCLANNKCLGEQRTNKGQNDTFL